MNNKSNFIKLIKSDLARITTPTMKNFLRWYFFPQGSTFPHDVWFRALQCCKKKVFLKYSIGILVYYKERKMSYKYGIHINSNINIGEGLKIVHADGVYINCLSIGKKFTVFQNVTLGTAGEKYLNKIQNTEMEKFERKDITFRGGYQQ